MTIADILFLTDKQSLLKIVLDYQLVNLIKIYFPQILDNDTKSVNEYSKLMMPSSYSGRAQRDKGALTQKHYQVIK
jgi:hypothetical protein